LHAKNLFNSLVFGESEGVRKTSKKKQSQEPKVRSRHPGHRRASCWPMWPMSMPRIRRASPYGPWPGIPGYEDSSSKLGQS